MGNAVGCGCGNQTTAARGYLNSVNTVTPTYVVPPPLPESIHDCVLPNRVFGTPLFKLMHTATPDFNVNRSYPIGVFEGELIYSRSDTHWSSREELEEIKGRRARLRVDEAIRCVPLFILSSVNYLGLLLYKDPTYNFLPLLLANPNQHRHLFDVIESSGSDFNVVTFIEQMDPSSSLVTPEDVFCTIRYFLRSLPVALISPSDILSSHLQSLFFEEMESCGKSSDSELLEHCLRFLSHFHYHILRVIICSLRCYFGTHTVGSAILSANVVSALVADFFSIDDDDLSKSSVLKLSGFPSPARKNSLIYVKLSYSLKENLGVIRELSDSETPIELKSLVDSETPMTPIKSNLIGNGIENNNNNNIKDDFIAETMNSSLSFQDSSTKKYRNSISLSSAITVLQILIDNNESFFPSVDSGLEYRKSMKEAILPKKWIFNRKIIPVLDPQELLLMMTIKSDRGDDILMRIHPQDHPFVLSSKLCEQLHLDVAAIQEFSNRISNHVQLSISEEKWKSLCIYYSWDQPEPNADCPVDLSHQNINIVKDNPISCCQIDHTLPVKLWGSVKLPKFGIIYEGYHSIYLLENENVIDSVLRFCRIHEILSNDIVTELTATIERQLQTEI